MRFTRATVLLATVLVISYAAVAWASDIGQEIANQVSVTSYQHYLGDMLYTHDGNNREALTGPDHAPARDNIVAAFESYGLAVELQSFTHETTICQNVIATQLGTAHPDSCYVIAAHYDSYSTPGADDDASGVASVLEIARILSAYDCSYTIKYIAFDAAQHGIAGSNAYVDAHSYDDILGMIAIDLIAYNPRSNRAEVHGSPSSATIKNRLANSIGRYGQGLTVEFIGEASGRSDHSPFEEAGFQACLLTEDNPDDNPCSYWTCDSVDTTGYINYAYAVKMTRGVAAYLAEHARAQWPFDCSTLEGCDPAEHGGQDCNSNGVWDWCDITCGASLDVNTNGIPDECEPQETWYVDAADCPGPGSGTEDDPFCRIQDGINAASDGASSIVEIIVADGVYTGTGNKNIDFGGKLITLRSLNGPADCIIDCQGNGRGFYFHSGETFGAIVRGLTIRHGSVGRTSPGGERGGGVLCSNSSPMLVNCLVVENTALCGGGIGCVSYANPSLDNCMIWGNTADAEYGYGGGLYCASSNPTLKSCTIQFNAAFGDTGFGGGAYCDASSPVMNDCLIIGNSSINNGGGICCQSSGPLLSRCLISDNAAGSGGGLYCTTYSGVNLNRCVIDGNLASGDPGDGGGLAFVSNATGSVIDCIIRDNQAVADNPYGAGVLCNYDSDPTLFNCIIQGNAARGKESAYGGGISLSGSDPKLTNCTINGNSADGVTSGYGGGTYFSNSSPTLTNCILWGDTPQEIHKAGSGTPTVLYCDVQGSYAGEGNIAADPLFAFADDLHLLPGSPCIDTGTDSPIGGLPSPDADGNPRPLDGDSDGQAVADMGAYEWNPSACRIALSPTRIALTVPQGQEGPAHATMSVRNRGSGSLQWSMQPSVSWVTAEPAQGTSTGEMASVRMSADASALPHGTHYASMTVIDIDSPDCTQIINIVLHVTGSLLVPQDLAAIQNAIDAAVPGDEVIVEDGVWSGPGNTNLDFWGKAITLRSASGNPAACVIDCQGSGRGLYIHSGETTTTVVTGLTIRNGNVTASSPGLACGGGVYCYFSSPTLTNCIINGNNASGYASCGGGVYCGFSACPVLTDCVISGNTASRISGPSGGGGVGCTNYSSPTLTNCSIMANTVNGNSGFGGGVYCYRYSDSVLTGCVISGNSVGGTYGYGGGVECGAHCAPILTDCVIEGNTALSGGGGVFWADSSKPTMTSCLISGNVAQTGGGMSCDNTAYGTLLADCQIIANLADRGAGVYYSGNSSTKLVNSTITANTASTAGGGIYCSDAHPVLTNCILWNDSPQEINLDSHSGLSMTYCDIQGGWAGTGNRDSDPLFANATNADYHLSPGSPCIDTGSNAAVPAGITTDLDGNPRFLDGDSDGSVIVDIGAYEYALAGDFNFDGILDATDYWYIHDGLGHCSPEQAYQQHDRADMDHDGCITLADYQDWLVCYRAATGTDFALLPPVPGLKGDMNGDGTLDTRDIAEFVSVLLGRSISPSRVNAADMDASGSANGVDIQLFIETLLGG